MIGIEKKSGRCSLGEVQRVGFNRGRSSASNRGLPPPVSSLVAAREGKAVRGRAATAPALQPREHPSQTGAWGSVGLMQLAGKRLQVSASHRTESVPLARALSARSSTPPVGRVRREARSTRTPNGGNGRYPSRCIKLAHNLLTRHVSSRVLACASLGGQLEDCGVRPGRIAGVRIWMTDSGLVGRGRAWPWPWPGRRGSGVSPPKC